MPKKPNDRALNTEEKAKITALLADGYTCHAVAKILGRDKKTIKRYATRPETARAIQVAKRELADYYEETAYRMLASITDEDIQRINAYQRTFAACAATDKMRLLRAQSTENVSVIEQVRLISEERERLLELLAKLREAKEKRVEARGD